MTSNILCLISLSKSTSKNSANSSISIHLKDTRDAIKLRENIDLFIVEIHLLPSCLIDLILHGLNPLIQIMARRICALFVCGKIVGLRQSTTKRRILMMRNIICVRKNWNRDDIVSTVTKHCFIQCIIFRIGKSSIHSRIVIDELRHVDNALNVLKFLRVERNHLINGLFVDQRINELMNFRRLHESRCFSNRSFSINHSLVKVIEIDV